jgi:hypothetical protein
MGKLSQTNLPEQMPYLYGKRRTNPDRSGGETGYTEMPDTRHTHLQSWQLAAFALERPRIGL